MNAPERARVGLCFACRHSKRIATPRSTFWLCRLAAVDARFEKYPRLPMRECAGYEPGPGAEASPAGPASS